MKEIALVTGVCIGVVIVALAGVALFGAALGLFFGSLIWAMQRVAGPVSGSTDPAVLWFTLALLALVVAADRFRGARKHA